MTPTKCCAALVACIVLALASACSRKANTGGGQTSEAGVHEADAFVARANTLLGADSVALHKAIADAAASPDADSQRRAIDARVRHLALLDDLIEQSRRYDGLALNPGTARAIARLRVLSTNPVPAERAQRAELASILVRLRAIHAAEPPCAADAAAPCASLAGLRDTLRNGSDPGALLAAWAGLHADAVVLGKNHVRYVELANAGAKRLGFADVGEYARARYDLDTDVLRVQTDRLWSQIKPFHDQLQCYTRIRLTAAFGGNAQSDGLIRAQFTGDIGPPDWSGRWSVLAPFVAVSANASAPAPVVSATRTDAGIEAAARPPVVIDDDRLPFLFRFRDDDPLALAVNDLLAMPRSANVASAQATADPQARIDAQMRSALDLFARLAFAQAVMHWRWGVFDGSIAPRDYNRAWWAMRARYEGIAPPAPRDAGAFDAGAVDAIAQGRSQSGVFLADILQFQLDRAACGAAGGKQPVFGCDLAPTTAAGKRLRAAIARGAEPTWPQVLADIGDGETIDADALLAYFQPLRDWLAKTNRGVPCGWEGNFSSMPPSP